MSRASSGSGIALQPGEGEHPWPRHLKNPLIQSLIFPGIFTLYPVQSHEKSRAVAQSGSAPVWGTGGREFESHRPDQFFHLLAGQPEQVSRIPGVANLEALEECRFING